MTIKNAIARSQSHNEIVHLTSVTPQELAELQIECDDWTRGNSELEFWGSDDGGEWRVHVAIEK